MCARKKPQTNEHTNKSDDFETVFFQCEKVKLEN